MLRELLMPRTMPRGCPPPTPQGKSQRPALGRWRPSDLPSAADVLAAGDRVEGVDIPAGSNVVATYPIATLTNAPNPDGAAAFVAFTLSEEGRAILARYGFSLP